MQNQKIILILVVVLAVASVGFSSYLFYQQQTEEPPKPAPNISFGGEPVDWTNPEAPSQSPALGQDEIPAEAVKLEVTMDGFVPDEFEVKAGSKVVLSLTAKGKWMHGIQFEDEILSGISILSNPGKTRVITFFAPEQKGEYRFSCAVPLHKETGVMVVK